jgi:hypothetical protein
VGESLFSTCSEVEKARIQGFRSRYVVLEGQLSVMLYVPRLYQVLVRSLFAEQDGEIGCLSFLETQDLAATMAESAGTFTALLCRPSFQPAIWSPKGSAQRPRGLLRLIKRCRRFRGPIVSYQMASLEFDIRCLL